MLQHVVKNQNFLKIMNAYQKVFSIKQQSHKILHKYEICLRNIKTTIFQYLIINLEVIMGLVRNLSKKGRTIVLLQLEIKANRKTQNSLSISGN